MNDWLKRLEEAKKKSWRLRWYSRWCWFELWIEMWWLDYPKKWLYCSWAHRGRKHQHINSYKKYDKWHCGMCLTYISCKRCMG